MRFDFEWQAAPGVRDKVLAATWARLELSVDGQPITEALDERSSSRRTGVYGPLFPLVEWFVENWWSMLYEPAPISPLVGGRKATPLLRYWVQRHNLLTAREGTALPDLTLAPDKDDTVLYWQPDPENGLNRRLRFIGHGQARVPSETFKEAVSSFVEAVVARLDALELQDSDSSRLRENWTAIKQSEHDDLDVCRSLAVLGLDPYDPSEATDEMTELLEGDVAALPSPLRADLLEGSTPAALTVDLSWLTQSRVAPKAGSTDWMGIDAVPLGTAGLNSAHQTGYQLARAVRKELLFLSRDCPILNLEDVLVERLNWSPDIRRLLPVVEASRIDSLVGPANDAGQPVIITQKPKATQNERFRLARAAYHVTAGTARSSPRLLTRAVTWHQRASRAFAAELLAPEEALRARASGSVTVDRVEELAAEFSVSSMVVKHQIENHGIGWVGED